MTVIPISAAKSQLSELVESTRTTREEYTITVNGRPAAVLISVDEWASIQESIFWLSQPGTLDDIAEARTSRAHASLDQTAIRERYGTPGRG